MGREWEVSNFKDFDVEVSGNRTIGLVAKHSIQMDKPIIELDILSAGFYSVRFIRFMSGVNAFIDLLTG